MSKDCDRKSGGNLGKVNATVVSGEWGLPECDSFSVFQVGPLQNSDDTKM